MPTHVYQDSIELEIDVLEAVPLTPESDTARSSAYPYPWLRMTGVRQRTTFETAVIENEFLKVTVVPALGGRILRILDKSTGTEILGAEDSLHIDSDQHRGASLFEGIICSPLPSQKTGLGPVDWQAVEPEDDSSPAGIWFFILDHISIHFGIFLPPDRAEISLELRCHNRTLESRPYEVALYAYVPYSDWQEWQHGATLYLGERNCSLAVAYKPGLGHWSVKDGTACFERFGSRDKRHLGAHQMDAWELSLHPLAGLGGITAISATAAASLGEKELQVRTAAAQPGAKIVLLLADGRTVETPAEFLPGVVSKFNLAALNSRLEQFVVLGTDRSELLRHKSVSSKTMVGEKEVVWVPDPAQAIYSEAVLGFLGAQADVPLIEDASFDIRYRAICFNLLAMLEMRKGDYAEAVKYFDEALLYNAEDPLTWALKATALRLSGEDPEDGAELPNAHFLAPLEPYLRGEAFLREPVANRPAGGTAGIIVSFEDNPAAMIEIGALLHLCGNYGDLSKWVHECLKYREIPMLRYFLADALLQSSNMRAEAAQHVVAAGKAGIQPPYPEGLHQTLVLGRLEDAFPSDPGLKKLSELLDWSARRA